MENAKKYTKLYFEESERNFNQWGYYYPPRDWQEFENWNWESFEKHLKDISGLTHLYQKTKLFLDILENLKDFGYLHAFEKKDFSVLNNVIYQNSRQALLRSATLASGMDHSSLLLHVFSSFSCNDFEVTQYFLPKNLMPARTTYFTQVALLLLLVVFYGRTELKKQAVEAVGIYLKKKTTALEKNVVRYFLALLYRDVEGVNSCLQELCKAYQRQGNPVPKMKKCFAQEIHGMYRFVKYIDEAFFEEISMPVHACFFKEFEQWQVENNFPKGELFYHYPAEMNYMNKIFAAEIPEVTLYEFKNGHVRELLMDAEKFSAALFQNVENLG